MKKQIENNFKYHAPKEEQVEKYNAIREKAKELAHLINKESPRSREKSLAITKLEEAVMWANASIARNGETERENVGGSVSSNVSSAITVNVPQSNNGAEANKIAEQINKQLSSESLGLNMINSLRR